MTSIRNYNTRSPKQIGDFGEGLVNYILIRKGHEVAKVDHVGADLISEFNGKQFAISVKTRYFKQSSKESKMCTIEDNNIAKLNHFSERFNFNSLFSLVICYADLKKIYVFIFQISKIDKILKKVKYGYSLNFSNRYIENLKQNKYIDFSCWDNEIIGDKNF